MFTVRSPFNTFISTTKGVLLSPVSFFRSVYWSSVSIVDGLIFFLIWNLISAIIRQFVFSGTAFPLGIIRGMNGFQALPIVAGLSLPAFLISPIIAMIFLFIGALLIFIITKVLFQHSASFSAVFVALALVSATQIISWIPLIGLLAGIYTLVLTVIAIRESTQISTVKSIIVLVIEIVVITFISGFFITQAFFGSRTNTGIPFQIFQNMTTSQNTSEADSARKVQDFIQQFQKQNN